MIFKYLFKSVVLLLLTLITEGAILKELLKVLLMEIQ